MHSFDKTFTGHLAKALMETIKIIVGFVLALIPFQAFGQIKEKKKLINLVFLSIKKQNSLSQLCECLFTHIYNEYFFKLLIHQ